MSTALELDRRVPRFGGLNPTLLRLELRRMLRNRRTIIFTLILPAALLLSFAGSDSEWSESVGHGNVAAYILVSMAVYGGALSAASGGAMVAIERATGWSRQLRLTPLHPVAYISVKAIVALVLGAISVTAVNLTGLIQGKAEMETFAWIGCALLTLLCTLVFAAAGVFVGYLVPGENAMQILGPALAVFAFLGNVFIPMDPGTTIYRIAEWTPMFGVAELSRWPLTGDLDWVAPVNVLAWLGIFVAGAAWRMSKDTARV